MIFVITRPGDREGSIVAVVKQLGNESVINCHGMIAQAWEDADDDDGKLLTILEGKGFEVLAFTEVELSTDIDLDELLAEEE